MKARRYLLALLASIVAGTAAAQQREYIIYDGQSYPGDQLDVAAASPVMVKPAQRLGNGDYSIPRAADGHYYIAGAVNGFPVVFMVDTGARFTTLPVKLARNAGIRAGRATSFDSKRSIDPTPCTIRMRSIKRALARSVPHREATFPCTTAWERNVRLDFGVGIAPGGGAQA